MTNFLTLSYTLKPEKVTPFWRGLPIQAIGSISPPPHPTPTRLADKEGVSKREKSGLLARARY